ncbi:MAG TPA: carboxypeptidase regulatory-like domain-containing protein [Vicinamibacterales bacterium]|nr:carboxypeptidase regulatory-like domain-containing protein [Vicinamibacterales bacterium]
MRLLVRSAFCLLLFASAAFAQSDRGTISGTVVDPDGAVVPGASVIAENPENGARYETVTTQTGNYTLSQLPVGNYNLNVELTGFGRFRQEGIRIFVGQTARVDAKLQVGNLAEEVNVVADASMLDTQSAEISSSVTSENLNSLPLNFGARGNFSAASIRNPYSFVTLVPGGNISNYSSLKVGGAPLNTFQIRVEGMEANNHRLMIRVDQVQPSVESLEEMTVHTSNFAPEYGQVAGGIFNLTAKSGTNTYRGSLFEYYVNEKLSAGIPFTNDGSGNLVRPPNRRNNFGGSLGGPATIPGVYEGRNRTFFFYTLEQFRQVETRAGLLQTMPTDRMRNGDFGEALTGRQLGVDPLGRPIMENAIYDPRTTRTVNGQVVRDPFPGNVIPRELLDPVALKWQEYIPRATRQGQLINNWDQSFPADTIKSISTLKVDHNFSASGKLSGYYSRYWGPHYNGSDGLPIPITAVRRFATSTHTIRVTYDWTLSPSTLMDTRVGYLRHWNPDFGLPEVREYDPIAGLGLVGAVDGIGFPVTNTQMFTQTGGGMSLGMAVAGSLPATKKPQALVTLTHTRNTHTYKTGFEWRDDIFSNPQIHGSHGQYTFSAQQTALPSTQGQNLGGGAVGLAYASFLMGRVNSALVSNPTDPNWHRPAISAFMQDTWRIKSNVTLDYGLRYDRQAYGYEQDDRRSMFSPDVPNPAAGGLLGATIYEGEGPGACNCRFVDTNSTSFGPRVGVSYQMTPKTVLRAGWGITYAQTGMGQSDGGSTLGAGGWNTFNFESPAFGEPGALLRDGLRYNRDALFAVTNNAGIRPSPGQVDSPPQWIHPDAGTMPKLNQWSVSVQRELTRDLVVDVAYVGNRGDGFTANNMVNLNAISIDRLKTFGLDINNAADRTLLNSRIDSPLAAQRGFNKLPYPSYSGANTVAQSLRPFPQFGTINALGVPLGASKYDSLQVKATKRYSNGLNMVGTFTWQNERTNMVNTATTATPNTAVANNVFDHPEDVFFPSELSEPLISVLAFNYEVPRFTQNEFVRAVLGGWTVGGIIRYASGTPIPVPASQNQLAALLFQNTRMSRVEGQPLYLKDLNNSGDYDPNRDFVLNPSAFANPAAGQFGASLPYYDDFRYQRRPDEQLSFGRNFRLPGRTRFEVRAEFFNAFNRIQLNNPDATNPLQTQQTNAQGVPTSGYGRINTGTVYGPPRGGQLVMRLSW